MASGLGSFVKGAFEGYQGVKDIQRKEALQKREDERYAMEQERFAAEKTRMAREEETNKLIDKARKDALAVEEEARTGTGRFAQLADPAAVQARQQTVQSVEQKADMSYDRAEARRLGRPVDETQTASVTPDEQKVYDFKSTGAGLYKDQRAVDNLKYDLLGSSTKQILLAKGDFASAMEVDQKIEKMKEEGYDRLRNNAAAFIMAGAPASTVIKSLNKVYGFIDDGKTLDETKSTFDPKTNTYSLAVVDQATGAVEQRPMNQMSLLTTLKQLTPAKLLEFNISEKRRIEDKDTEEARYQEGLKLKKEELGIARTKAGSEAALNKLRGDLLTDQVKGADVKAKVEAIDKSFPNADRALKLDEQVGDKAAIKSLRESIAADTLGKQFAVGLASVNPKLDPRIIVGAAKAATTTVVVPKKDPATGRTYFDYGGTQIFLK